MRLRRASGVLLCTLLLSTILPALASAGAWLLEPGEYYSAFRGKHFSAATFHDNNGDRVAFPLDGVVEERELVSYNEFGFKKSTALVLAIQGLSRTLMAGNPSSSLTQTGLGDILLGLRFKLIGGPTALSVQADWEAPLGYDREAVPPLGPGQQNVTGRMLFGTSIVNRGFIDASAGYRYRFEGPLDEFDITGDVAFWIGPILAAGRYDYTKSVGTSTTPQQEIKSNLLGPEVTYRVDDRFDIFAGSSHTVSARNAPHADRYYVGIAVKHTALGPLQGFLGGKPRP